jgi:tripartite-type tricarboxylate transporter receptor subunit TctC
MNLPRRRFLHLAAGAAALPAGFRLAWAQAYPTRPVHILVGFAPGGPTDIAARLIGQWLSDRLGQPFIVENRPGAATNIATEAVVRSPPDGYTLLAAVSSNTMNPALYTNLGFNFIRDIAMVAGIQRSPLVLEVHPSVPVTSVPELIAYVKANPGKISLASFGSGTISQVAGELFKMGPASKWCTCPIVAPHRWSLICSAGRYRLPSITSRHRSSTSERANCVPSPS